MKDSTYSDLVIVWFSQCKTHIFFTSFIWFTNVQNSMFLRGKEKQVWGGQRARYIFFFWQSQQRDKLDLSTEYVCGALQSVHIWWDKAQTQRAVGLYGDRIMWFKGWEETLVEIVGGCGLWVSWKLRERSRGPDKTFCWFVV